MTCLPPAGTPGVTWHWVQAGKNPPEIALWDDRDQSWTMCRHGDFWSANGAARLGYRYLEPVTPPRAEDGGRAVTREDLDVLRTAATRLHWAELHEADPQAKGGMGDRYLPLREVENRAGIKHSAIYRKMATGDFPRARALGPRTVRWLESELEEWIRTRPTTGSAPVEGTR